MSLVDQPPELLDHIACFICSTRDLLSVALTCRLLHGIVIPEHLEFRVVRCDPLRNSLWQAVAEHPGSASRIQTLELISESSSSNPLVLVPKSLMTEQGRFVKCTEHRHDQCTCTDPLIKAITSMHGLARLCCHTPTTVAVFSAIVQNCPNLREIEISHYDSWNAYFHTLSAPLWTLSNLTVLSITVRRHPGMLMEPYAHLPAMFEMLSRCPSLHDLRLAFECRKDVNIGPLLSKQTWPQLKRLVLEGDLQKMAPKKLNAFLHRHKASLEILSLAGVLSNQPLPLMPRLRWLYTYDVKQNLSTAAQFPSLEHVAAANVYTGDGEDLDNVIDRLGALPRLRGITLKITTAGDLEKLGQTVPHLERLILAGAPWNTGRCLFRNRSSRTPTPECIDILRAFTSLTHLDSAAGIQIDDASSDNAASIDAPLNSATTLDEMLGPLLHSFAAVLPRLRYVCVDIKEPECDFPRSVWYTLVRDADGVLISWEKTKRLDNVRFHDWEDLTRSIGIWRGSDSSGFRPFLVARTANITGIRYPFSMIKTSEGVIRPHNSLLVFVDPQAQRWQGSESKRESHTNVRNKFESSTTTLVEIATVTLLGYLM
ncbi:hypothetical protein C8R43DRAFT_1110139 [Mycena crocata]|nr:hypothetical protein C8R43DRAFT_1110139 [Mycena crocata]